MKIIDKEKWQRMMAHVRLRFGLRYYGKSNNMNITVEVNDRKLTNDSMSDEEVVLLWQLLDSVQTQLGMELVKRDLIPDEMKRFYMYNNPPKADA